METYTVSFFGHRELSDSFSIEARLQTIIRDLVLNKEYIEFLVGREGEFDQIVASTIRYTKEHYGSENSALVLVLPYMKAEYRDNMDSFLNYYDEVEICDESADTYFKAAIQIRNRCMVDRSDLIVFCVERKHGGAYMTMKYALSNKEKIINLCSDRFSSNTELK